MAAFLLTLVKLSLLGSVLAVLLMLVRPFIKSKAAAYYLWLLVLARLCLPWGVTIPLPARPMEPVTLSQTQTVQSDGTQTQPVQEGTEEDANPAPAPLDWRGVVTSSTLWFVLWGAGAALWLGRYVWGYRRFAALVRASARPAGEEAKQVLATLAPQGRVTLLECVHVHTPMLLGVVRPAIVLPRGVEADRLEDILSHELTHARRHDLLYKWLAAAVTSLHWFNPPDGGGTAADLPRL
ncbi:M56 family metallopeptidase [Flavonifractor sp. AGMB03687]|uniref:M56 family metallopeptidase n=1 Tax=Flavonifractor sp. AGMB03687 TaxID=2785133 RepID=UPI001AE06BE6|nr:M56 family metallopeptidase [Flavonifractor sp. AGMB03687]